MTVTVHPITAVLFFSLLGLGLLWVLLGWLTASVDPDARRWTYLPEMLFTADGYLMVVVLVLFLVVLPLDLTGVLA